MGVPESTRWAGLRWLCVLDIVRVECPIEGLLRDVVGYREFSCLEAILVGSREVRRVVVGVGVEPFQVEGRDDLVTQLLRNCD